jgi:hypothetical protein
MITRASNGVSLLVARKIKPIMLIATPAMKAMVPKFLHISPFTAYPRL